MLQKTNQKREAKKGRVSYSISWSWFILGFLIAFVLSYFIKTLGLGLSVWVFILLWLLFFSWLLYREMKGKGDPDIIGFYVGCLGLLLGLIECAIWEPKSKQKRTTAKYRRTKNKVLWSILLLVLILTGAVLGAFDGGNFTVFLVVLAIWPVSLLLHWLISVRK
jgi:L-lactate permease